MIGCVQKNCKSVEPISNKIIKTLVCLSSDKNKNGGPHEANMTTGKIDIMNIW